jgi:pimeloyl-ACP methyl ester carboxylesterase
VTVMEPIDVDLIERGSGPPVVLVHSSLAGARQWRNLMAELESQFCVRAVNLFGYGRTPPWTGADAPSLADFGALVASTVRATDRAVTLVGHSFGGAVAMEAARQLRGQVERLVLIEPSLFSVLDAGGRSEAYGEIAALGDATRRSISAGDREGAAQGFIDYWCGTGTWAATPADKRAPMRDGVGVLTHEWNAALCERGGASEWIEALPRRALLILSSDTPRPAREVVEVLHQACPAWRVERIHGCGHMAPLTHPQLVNRLIAAFLAEEVQQTSLAAG